jgi:hypothetical protein
MEKKISKFILQVMVFIVLIAGPVVWESVVQAQDAPPSETTYDFEDDLVTGAIWSGLMASN